MHLHLGSEAGSKGENALLHPDAHVHKLSQRAMALARQLFEVHPVTRELLDKITLESSTDLASQAGGKGAHAFFAKGIVAEVEALQAAVRCDRLADDAQRAQSLILWPPCRQN